MTDQTAVQPSPHGEARGAIPGSGVLYPAIFIAKLWDIVNDSKNWDAIRWTEDGTTIRIIDKRIFESRVLPSYFQHNRLISFVRQLNAYGFHKVSDSLEYLEFQHPIFQRNGHSNIKAIQRKKGDRRRGKSDPGNLGDNDDDWEHEQNPYDEPGVGSESHIHEPYSEYDSVLTVHPTSASSNLGRPTIIPRMTENILQSKVYQPIDYGSHYYSTKESQYKPQNQIKAYNHGQLNTEHAQLQARQQIQSAVSVASSPIDRGNFHRANTQGRSVVSSKLPTINEAKSNQPASRSIVKVPIQLLKDILSEVQDLKIGMQNIIADVKKLQEQNHETQQYMFSVLQEIFSPVTNADTQNYLNLDGREFYQAGSGNAPSSGSFRSSGTRAPGPTLSLEASMGVFRQTAHDSQLMSSPLGTASTPFQQPFISPYFTQHQYIRHALNAQPPSSISDNMMTSPPSSDLLLTGTQPSHLNNNSDAMPNSDQL